MLGRNGMPLIRGGSSPRRLCCSETSLSTGMYSRLQDKTKRWFLVPADQRSSEAFPCPCWCSDSTGRFWNGLRISAWAEPTGEAQRGLNAGAQRGPNRPQNTQESTLGLDQRAGFLPLPTRKTS
uniref:Uncharacterized protein n=1 Tax=Rousettus aegyptiacus TaxID=9407 RepID=A0A7J8FJ86_ROUAE|nr:hypothetical protein HJG63_012139 [Rousettus aegyptiacus]